MRDYYEYSVPELIRLLGARFKDYRLPRPFLVSFQPDALSEQMFECWHTRNAAYAIRR